MKNKFLLSIAGLMVFALMGCGDTGTNTSNNANRVTNLGTNNANNAYVVNNNTNTGSMTNSNRWSSNVNRADYDKDRANYEREKRTGETIGQGANDSWLWFKTRAALATTDDLRDSTIDVDAVNNVITLKGTVASAAQKTKAEQVAKGIDGVTSVKNELKVAANDSMTNTGGGNTGSNNRNTNANSR